MTISNLPQPERPTEFLYHYTSQKGLLGIIGHKKLWATNILYLNDGAELFHTIDLIVNGMEIIRENDEDFSKNEDFLFNEIEKILHDIDEQEQTKEFYVCSLSSESDKLSQWRGYCPDGNGYSIGFDFRSNLFERVKQQGFVLAKCEYADKYQFPSSIQDLLWEVRNTYRQESRKASSTKAKNALRKYNFIENFLRIAPYIKDRSFEEEKEWRLVGRFKDTSQVKFREGKFMLIPYMEIDLQEDSGEINIPEIYIGPTPHPKLSTSSIFNFLKTQKCYAYNEQLEKDYHDFFKSQDPKEKTSPRVSTSNSPYRTW